MEGFISKEKEFELYPLWDGGQRRYCRIEVMWSRERGYHASCRVQRCTEVYSGLCMMSHKEPVLAVMNALDESEGE